MISISHIKNTLFCFSLLFSMFCIGQNGKEVEDDFDKDLNIINSQRLGYFSADYYFPQPNGNNFIGRGTEGKSGFNAKLQFYVYKQFFVGITLGNTYLQVSDPSFTGNYSKTTIRNQYLFMGYEFLPFDKTRFGLSLGIIGDAYYHNTSFTDSRKAFQNDKGKLRSYEVYFDYEIDNNFSLYFNYAYRNDKMKINAPPELQSNFERSSFHTFGLGIKFNFGSTDIFSLF